MVLSTEGSRIRHVNKEPQTLPHAIYKSNENELGNIHKDEVEMVRRTKCKSCKYKTSSLCPQRFLDTQRSTNHKIRKKNKVDLLRKKTFCASKDSVKKMKSHRLGESISKTYL